MRPSKLFVLATVLISIPALTASNADADTKRRAFPGVEYSYVKLYLYNTLSEEEVAVDKKSKDPRFVDTRTPEEKSRRVDSHIMTDGRYSRSKIGSGVRVPDDLVASLNKLISGGTPELLEGLSKCFVPRHGFVYYDREHRPVASVSICFECEGLRVYPAPKARASRRFRIRRAHRQLAALESIVRRAEVPVFERPEAYTSFVTSEETYRSVGDGASTPPAGFSTAAAGLGNWPAVRDAWGDTYPPLRPPTQEEAGEHVVQQTRHGTRFEFLNRTHASCGTSPNRSGPWDPRGQLPARSVLTEGRPWSFADCPPGRAPGVAPGG
jgi:hypothetical protein